MPEWRDKYLDYKVSRTTIDRPCATNRADIVSSKARRKSKLYRAPYVTSILPRSHHPGKVLATDDLQYSNASRKTRSPTSPLLETLKTMIIKSRGIIKQRKMDDRRRVCLYRSQQEPSEKVAQTKTATMWLAKEAPGGGDTVVSLEVHQHQTCLVQRRSI